MTIKSNIIYIILAFTTLSLISCKNSNEQADLDEDEDSTLVDTYGKYYRDARDHQTDLDFDNAIAGFKKCLHHDYQGDNDSILYFTTQSMMQVMNCYQSKGEPEECVRYFRLLPDSSPYIRRLCMRDYYSIFGYALSRTERMAEAEKTITKALGMKLHHPTHKRLFRDFSYAAAVFYCNPSMNGKVIDLSKKAIEEAKRSNNTTGVQWVTSLLGNVYKRTGRIEEAIDMFQESVEESKEIGDDFGELNAYNAIAGLCLYWNIPYYANMYASMAVDKEQNSHRRNPMVSASAYINKGEAMQQLNKFDSAFYYYDLAEKYCQELPYNSGQVDIDLQKGIYLTSECKGDSMARGMEVLRKVAENATPINRAKAYHQMAITCLDTGDDSMAEEMLDSMYNLLNKTDYSFFIGIDYDKILSYYFACGNTAKAEQYTKYMLSERKFSLDNGINMKMSESIVKLHTDRMDKELQLANSRLYNSKLTLRTYILALVFILLVTLLLFFYKHRVLRIRMQLANEKLVGLTDQIDRLLIERENADASGMVDASFDDDMMNYDDDSISSDSILNEEDETRFRQRFSTLYPSFFRNLHQRCPLIGRREEMLCMLIVLGQNNHQIANLMAIALRSVHMLRHRLRQKMNLAKDESLEQVVNEMAKSSS